MAVTGPTRAHTEPPAQQQEPSPTQQQAQRRPLHHRLHASTLFGRPTTAESASSATAASPSTAGSEGVADAGPTAPPPSRQQHSFRRDAAGPQSAIELRPPISFDHLLRRDREPRPPHDAGKGGDGTRKGGSGAGERAGNLDGTGEAAGAERQRRREVTAGDVLRTRAANARREEELRASVQRVEELGMRETRRLDDTFYAVLEKATVLRSTVAALQVAADEAGRMRAALADDASALARDTAAQLDGFGDLAGQERGVQELAGALQRARDDTAALDGRLEEARRRVEAYEARESRREARRRKRWQMTGAVLVLALLLVAAVLVARHRRALGRRLDVVGHKLVRVADAVEEGGAAALARLRPSPSEDAYLRALFDEL